jgi:uncharacterized repeat protein (TIGR03806 family)
MIARNMPAAKTPRRFAGTATIAMATRVAILAAAASLPAAADDGAPFFDAAKRIPWTTSRIVGTPEPPPPYRIERVYPRLAFDEPVSLVAEPGTDRLLVVERKGKIWRFNAAQATAERELYLDLGHESFSLAFHPKYGDNGFIFVFRNLLKDGTYSRNRISKFRTRGDGRRTVDPASEEALLEWNSRGHNGGDLAFGPDGMLYISSGDGETGVDDPDPIMTGQDLSDLRGGILRIDVDRREGDRPYAIPPDNPFRAYPGARPELWAFGLRNPWRFSFDRETARMWIGDNGEETWESIHLGKRGANYGWSVVEGSHPFNLARPAAPVPFERPIVEHAHSEARSVIGGRVYRGGSLNELSGVYVYGDHETGKVWGLRHDGEAVTWHKELASTNRKIISFAEDHHRELLVVTFDGGVFRLVDAEAANSANAFPRRLSDTGLFAAAADHRPADGLIPYSIIVPAWADGASAERFIAVPGIAKVKYQTEQGWEFADGSVLVQTFSLPDASGNERRIETRLLHRHQNEWHGYSYRWNDDQTDANLVPAEGATRSYATAATGATSVEQRTWHFPSRAQCIVCHSLWGPRYIIGVSTAQMNRTLDYGGVRANQIELLARLGILENSPGKDAAELPKLVDPFDPSANLDRRARSYLHANCAHCHRYGGTGNARMRLGFEASDEETRVFDVPPEHGSFGIDEARLIAPRYPERSVLFYRMAKLGRGRMPHLGSQSIDVNGLALIDEWVRSQQAKGASTALPPVPEIVQLGRHSLDAAERARWIDRLFATTSGAMRLERALARKQFDDAVQADAVARAAAHADPNVRDLFERFLPEERRGKRLGDVILPEQILPLAGHAEHGKRLFFEAATLQCRSCHQVAGQGVATGPDLSSLKERTTRAELLESLLQPSRFVDPRYQAYVVVTADGRTFSGLLARRDDREVVIRDSQNNDIRLAAGEVESVHPQRKSLMPEGLLRDLTPQEAADLLEFLHTLGRR